MIIGFDATSVGRYCTGIEYYTLFLARRLPRIDDKNRYVVFARDRFVEADIGDGRAAVVKCSGSRLVAQHVFLPFAAARHRIDFLHFPAFPPLPTVKNPLVVTIHDAVVWKQPQTLRLRSRLYFDVLYRAAARKALAVVTVSESAKRDIAEAVSIPEERIHVAYPGVAEHFRREPNPERLERVKRRYGLPQRFVLFVGTFEPRKNLPLLIQAFTRMIRRQDMEDVRLVLVGRAGWGFSEVTAAISSSGIADRVIVLGYVDVQDLVSLYNLATAFVYPSLYEGFGSPPLESMACGTPTLVSNIAPFLELTRGAALTADPTSVDDVCAGLENICLDANLRARLSREGPQVARLYRWEDTASNLVEIYQRLAS